MDINSIALDAIFKSQSKIEDMDNRIRTDKLLRSIFFNSLEATQKLYPVPHPWPDGHGRYQVGRFH